MLTALYVPPAQEPAIRTTLSPPEFMLQFTGHERVGIRAFAKSPPAGAEMAGALVADWLEVLADPRLTHVDLTHEATQAGVRNLILLGLLTPERAEAILAGIRS